nr:Stage III sporulation protein D [Moritella viscosa]
MTTITKPFTKTKQYNFLVLDNLLNEEHFSIKQLCEFFGCGKSTIYAAIAKNNKVAPC